MPVTDRAALRIGDMVSGSAAANPGTEVNLEYQAYSAAIELLLPGSSARIA